MAPSAALREEPRSGSLARGRPRFIHYPRVAVKPTLSKEAFVPSGHTHSQRKRSSLLDS